MYTEWITTDFHSIVMVVASSIVVYAAVLGLTRLIGLRSFSKMSAADFAVTVAIGSLLASTVTAPNPALVIGLVAMASLYFFKWLLSVLRMKYDWFSNMMDNEPLLLMAGGKIIDENLRKAQITRADIFAKLRESNAYNYDLVLAVIFETTGDISVIHSANEDTHLEPDFFSQVRGSEQLFEN